MLVRGFGLKCVQQLETYSVVDVHSRYLWARWLKPLHSLLVLWQFVTSGRLEGRPNPMGNLFVSKLLDSRLVTLWITFRLSVHDTGSRLPLPDHPVLRCTVGRGRPLHRL